MCFWLQHVEMPAQVPIPQAVVTASGHTAPLSIAPLDLLPLCLMSVCFWLQHVGAPAQGPALQAVLAAPGYSAPLSIPMREPATRKPTLAELQQPLPGQRQVPQVCLTSNFALIACQQIIITKRTTIVMKAIAVQSCSSYCLASAESPG